MNAYQQRQDEAVRKAHLGLLDDAADCWESLLAESDIDVSTRCVISYNLATLYLTYRQDRQRAVVLIGSVRLRDVPPSDRELVAKARLCHLQSMVEDVPSYQLCDTL